MTELPPAISGASAWFGPDVAARTDWIEPLSPAEISEIEAAGQRLMQSEIDWQTLRPEDFPLPTLERRLPGILDDVLEGRGFVLLRGLPVERWSRRLSAIAFLGLGLHWGNLRSQNRQGHLLGHVIDMGLSSQDPNVRIYQTRERQNFHTDSSDVVALLCLHPAREGGLSSLVSSVTIFNEMRKRRPDLARVLFAPIETDRRGEVPAGQKPFFCIPVFNWHAGLLSTVYHRPYIESARRFSEVPALTTEQIEALDLFDASGQRSGLAILHGASRRRHSARAQSHATARPHGLRGLAGASAQTTPAASLAGARESSAAPPRLRGTVRLGVPGQRGGIVVPGMRYTIPWER